VGVDPQESLGSSGGLCAAQDMKRGLFFSLDGLDGAGKSTQCRLLAQWLRSQNRTVVECVDPGGTELGKHLRSLLLEYRGQMALPCEALLFMASRAQLVNDVIRPALEAGSCVVSDRYLLANIFYQGHAGGLEVDLLWKAGQLSTGGLQPDLTMILDLPLEVAVKRRKASADRLESRGDDYFAKVREGFLREAEQHPGRMAVVDASQSPDVVQALLRELAAGFLAVT
jgi:dTMP kinase